MRDPKRIKEMLKEIETLWKRNPDQRLFQLLFNYTRFDPEESNFYFLEDEDILNDLRKANNKKPKPEVLRW